MQTKNFSYTVEKTEGGNVFKLIWNNDPVNNKVYNKIVKYVKTSTDYGLMTDGKLTDYKKFLHTINKAYGADVTIDQAIAIRNIVLKDKIIKNYARMNQIIERITSKYETGEDILDLSARYDFPPLNLLRGIFINKGISSSKLYEIFANKTNPKTLLSGRDLTQYIRAEKNDAESTFNQQIIVDLAIDNELTVINFFKSIGIKLHTQEELVRQQTKKYGRPVITPDILFIDKVYINGVRVHWLDYKDYVGTDIRFLFTSNVNQSAKYNEKWGKGALCYHQSYVEGLIIPGTVLLDARSLPIKLRKK